MSMKRVIREGLRKYNPNYIEAEKNPRNEEYMAYLHNHIRSVQLAWEYLREHVVNDSRFKDVIADVDKHVMMHDESKYDPEEFDAYLNHWYPADGSEPSDEDELPYQYAWLHHLHNNPHHWQHWVLLNDDGSLNVLDMPVEYVLEMVADWSSFCWRYPGSTGKKWYDENGSKMQLSDVTRALVDELIQYMDVEIELPEDEKR